MNVFVLLFIIKSYLNHDIRSLIVIILLQLIIYFIFSNKRNKTLYIPPVSSTNTFSQGFGRTSLHQCLMCSWNLDVNSQVFFNLIWSPPMFQKHASNFFLENNMSYHIKSNWLTKSPVQTVIIYIHLLISQIPRTCAIFNL